MKKFLSMLMALSLMSVSGATLAANTKKAPKKAKAQQSRKAKPKAKKTVAKAKKVKTTQETSEE